MNKIGKVLTVTKNRMPFTMHFMFQKSLQKSQQDKLCVKCNMSYKETIYHCIVDCDDFNTMRGQFWNMISERFVHTRVTNCFVKC